MAAAARRSSRWASRTRGIPDGEIGDGRAVGEALAGQGREAFGTINFTWPIRQARAKVSGVTVFGESAGQPGPQDAAGRFEAGRAGAVDAATGRTSFQKGDRLRGDMQARDLALAAGPLDKSGGRAAADRHQGQGRRPSATAKNVPHVRLTVTEAAGQFRIWSGRARADMLYRYSGGEMDLLTARVSSSGQSKQLGEFVSLVPSAVDWHVQGHAAWEGACTFEKQTGWRLEDVDVGFWPVEWAWLVRRCGSRAW